MPASSTAILRSLRRRMIVASEARVEFGSAPRSASLAPSSRITASVPSRTEQSSRARPPAAVSPDTPAFAMSTASPFALSARASFAGRASCAPSPNPALSESPSTTMQTGRSCAKPARERPATNARAVARPRANWTARGRFPYDRLEPGVQKDRMNQTSAPAIRLSGVNLSLGRGPARVHILKDIDLHIGAGEAVGLVGPSGSGKSTLLMVAAGLERPDTGSVRVAGQDLNALDEDGLARFRGRHVGIVFQSFHLIPTMTALENVAVPLELAGETDAFDRAAAELASVGLRDRVKHYPAELSGGEQQRVALARALAPHPAILVADEPTGNLDDATGREIVELLFAGHEKRGTTLVLVTHDAALAHRCDRVVRLRSGHIEAPERGAGAASRRTLLARTRGSPGGSRCGRCAAACAASRCSSPASRSA